MSAKVRITYPQDWTAYNLAQKNEKAKFQLLLFELCRELIDPLHRKGRPQSLIGDVVFSAALKVYAGVSGRRLISDLREAEAKGYLFKVPGYNTIFDHLETEMMTGYLRELIALSSHPLKAIESDFAVDSSGFSTGSYICWTVVKHGKEEEVRQADWIKLHLMCGVKTNIVTSVEVSGRYANDSPFYQPLLEATIEKGFHVREVSADKAYQSAHNLRITMANGATPYIPFKIDANPLSGKSEVWRRLFHFYWYHHAEFKKHYHKRSNVETTFSMIKAKFGERLRMKGERSRHNEVLLKVLCHNLCCVIQSMYELGIDPVFRLEP